MIIDTCEWQPASNVYTGTAEAAIHRFTEIPKPIRAELIERVRKNQYDEVVTIKAKTIEGASAYDGAINYMHFGSRGNVCRTVTRNRWKESDSQLALAFCVGGTCIIRPAVCNNWAIVTRNIQRSERSNAGTVAESEPGNNEFRAIGGGTATRPGDSSVTAVGLPRAEIGAALTPEPGWSVSPLPPVWIGPPAIIWPVPPAPPVPEAPTSWLMLAGAFALVAVIRRKRKR